MKLTIVGAATVLLAVAAPTRSAAQNPVSHWAAEGNALDNQGVNHGTLNNGVTFGPGPIGQAFGFNGNSYMSAGTVGMPTGNANRTIFLRFNITSQIASEAFLGGYGGFGTFNAGYELISFNNKLWFSQWGDAIGGGTFGFGEWHTAAVTNVGNSVKLYLDGSQVAAKEMTINTQAATQFYLGRIPGTLGDIRRLNGFIDEVYVFDRALSGAEIIALGNVPEPSALLLIIAASVAVGVRRLARRRTA